MLRSPVHQKVDTKGNSGKEDEEDDNDNRNGNVLLNHGRVGAVRITR